MPQPQEFPSFLHNDLKIREYVKKKLQFAAVAKIVIERAWNSIRVTIHTARPGIVIGRKGAEIEKMTEEISKMAEKSQQKGYTIVPLKMYLAKGRAKVEVALARGKKIYDKREAIAEREGCAVGEVTHKTIDDVSRKNDASRVMSLDCLGIANALGEEGSGWKCRIDGRPEDKKAKRHPAVNLEPRRYEGTRFRSQCFANRTRRLGCQRRSPFVHYRHLVQNL